MSSTYVTIVIAATDREQANLDLDNGDVFSIPLSADGAEPITNYAASGWFLNDQLDYIANEATWPKTMKFGTDLDSQLASLGLQIVVIQAAEEPVADPAPAEV